MKKILFIIFVVGILLVGTVSAMSEHQKEVYDRMTNIFTKIRYGFSHGFFGLFTSWGEQNYCATDDSGYNDETGKKVGYDDFWAEPGDRIDCTDVCSYDKCAIDYYPDKTIYLMGGGPTWSNIDWNAWKEKHGEGAYLSVPSTYDWYWVEVYCCPKEIPSGDDWETKVYVCENNKWVSKGYYEKDDSCKYDSSGCWCNDEDENFYVDKNGAVHCRESSYSSVNDGTWCPSYIAHYSKDCVTSGSTSTLYWYDSNGARNDLIETCSSDEQCTTSGCVKTCKSKNEICIPGLGQCCSGLTCYGVCLGTEGECTIGDTKCEGTTSYECENYKWVNKGKIEGKCGYSGVVSHYTKKCYNNDVYWYDSSGSKEDKYEECGTKGCSNGKCGEVITPTCSSGFDSNKDNTISRDEIGDAIGQWINGQIDRNKLGTTIMEWVSGC